MRSSNMLESGLKVWRIDSRRPRAEAWPSVFDLHNTKLASGAWHTTCVPKA